MFGASRIDTTESAIEKSVALHLRRASDRQGGRERRRRSVLSRALHLRRASDRQGGRERRGRSVKK